MGEAYRRKHHDTRHGRTHSLPIALFLAAGISVILGTGMYLSHEMRNIEMRYQELLSKSRLLVEVTRIQADLDKVRAEMNILAGRNKGSADTMMDLIADLKDNVDSRFRGLQAAMGKTDEDKLFLLEDALMTWKEFFAVLEKVFYRAVQEGDTKLPMGIADGIQEKRYERLSEQLNAISDRLVLEIEELEAGTGRPVAAFR